MTASGKLQTLNLPHANYKDYLKLSTKFVQVIYKDKVYLRQIAKITQDKLFWLNAIFC